jgi:hypothetical protein
MIFYSFCIFFVEMCMHSCLFCTTHPHPRARARAHTHTHTGTYTHREVERDGGLKLRKGEKN